MTAAATTGLFVVIGAGVTGIVAVASTWLTLRGQKEQLKHDAGERAKDRSHQVRSSDRSEMRHTFAYYIVSAEVLSYAAADAFNAPIPRPVPPDPAMIERYRRVFDEVHAKFAEFSRVGSAAVLISSGPTGNLIRAHQATLWEVTRASLEHDPRLDEFSSWCRDLYRAVIPAMQDEIDEALEDQPRTETMSH